MYSTHLRQKQFAASVAAADTQLHRELVRDALDDFDASLAARLQPSKRSGSRAATGRGALDTTAARSSGTAGAGKKAGVTTAQRLRAQAAYLDSRSLIGDALRVQRAAAWLSQCPSQTLRVLQRRVLCSSEALFVGFGGIPARLKPHMAQLPFAETLRAAAELGGDEEGEEPEVPASEAITFLDFLSTYVLEDPSSTDGTTGVLVDTRTARTAPKKKRGKAPNEEDPAAAVTVGTVTHTRVFLPRVLAARPTSTSAHLPHQHQVAVALAAAPYDLRNTESALTYTVDTTLTDSADEAHPNDQEVQLQKAQVDEAAAAARAAVLTELAHWSKFFVECLDEQRTGVCDDSVSLVCAILLACGQKGAVEASSTPEAVAGRAVQQLQAQASTASHVTTCPACRHQRQVAECVCRRTVQAQTAARQAPAGVAPPQTRFFLSTAAVVLWAQAFLHLHRGAGSAAPREDRVGGEERDALPPAEVFFLRDWLRQQSEAEAVCLQREATGSHRRGRGDDFHRSTLRVATSCASNSAELEVSFTQKEVDAALGALGEWAQQSIEQQYALTASALLKLLREMLPVSAYYATFFC